MKKIFAIALSLSLMYSSTIAKTIVYNQTDITTQKIAELKAQYPDAKFYAMPAGEFVKQVKNSKNIKIKDRNYILIDEKAEEKIAKNLISKKSGGFRFPAGNPEGFVVLLAVVGIFIIGFVIVNGLYVLAYALTHGKADNYWFDIGITSSHMIGTDGSDESIAKTGGIVISTGITQNKTKLHKDTKSGFGFIGEIGHMYISFDDNTTNDEKLQGSYAMIGPTFRFYFDKRVSFHIDMMAGKSQDENIGTIGAFRVGVKAPMTRNTFFDITYGASYFELADEDSEIFEKNTKRNNIYQTFGLAFGYSF